MGPDNKKDFIGHLSLSILLPGIRFAYGLFLAAILTKYLSLEHYGSWSLFMGMIGLVLTFSSFNLMYSSQVLLTGKNAEDQKKEIFSVSVSRLFSTVAVFLLFSLYFIYKEIFSAHLLTLMFAALIFRVVNDTVFGLSRALLLIKKQITFLVIESFFILSFIIVNYGIFDGGLYGTVYAFLLAEIISSAIGFSMLRRYWCLAKYDMGTIKKYLAIGIPLVPFAFSDLIINSFVPLLIKLYHGFEQIALYSIAQKVALVSTIPAAIVNNIYVQYLKKAKDRTGSRGVVKVFFSFLSIYMIMAIPVFLILLFFGKEIIVFISSEQYAVSYGIMILLAVVNIIIMVTSMLSSIFAVYNRTKIIGFIWIAVLAFYMIINRILVPIYELPGVVYSLIIAFSAGLICVLIALFSAILHGGEKRPDTSKIDSNSQPPAEKSRRMEQFVSGPDRD